MDLRIRVRLALRMKVGFFGHLFLRRGGIIMFFVHVTLVTHEVGPKALARWQIFFGQLACSQM
jgi:hypothetical protein